MEKQKWGEREMWRCDIPTCGFQSFDKSQAEARKVACPAPPLKR
jgi:ssDNA-binding Zn-finger/Zn-ribbon topoisomerase 1